MPRPVGEGSREPRSVNRPGFSRKPLAAVAAAAVVVGLGLLWFGGEIPAWAQTRAIADEVTSNTADGDYRAGAEIDVRATLDEAVSLTRPTITDDSTYPESSGETGMATRTIGSNHHSPAPGATGSLTADEDLLLFTPNDTTAPTVTVSVGSAANSYKAVDDDPGSTTWVYRLIAGTATCDSNTSFTRRHQLHRRIRHRPHRRPERPEALLPVDRRRQQRRIQGLTGPQFQYIATNRHGGPGHNRLGRQRRQQLQGRR